LGSRIYVAALALVLIAPVASLAQNSGDAGVSGIPRGPGSVGGLNNSINDPSGSRNAAPTAPPPPSMAVPAVPSAAPAVSPRFSATTPALRRVKLREERVSRRKGHRSEKARAHVENNRTIEAQDRVLNSKLKSICRGC
jgi:hypothetical protein